MGGCAGARTAQVAYPILLGRMHPEGHPAYPGMGSFFAVQVPPPAARPGAERIASPAPRSLSTR